MDLMACLPFGVQSSLSVKGRMREASIYLLLPKHWLLFKPTWVRAADPPGERKRKLPSFFPLMICLKMSSVFCDLLIAAVERRSPRRKGITQKREGIKIFWRDQKRDINRSGSSLKTARTQTYKWISQQIIAVKQTWVQKCKYNGTYLLSLTLIFMIVHTLTVSKN